ncbi:MAG: right-handed parallel beta-helix repeat-containing protein, partial [Actinomycetota bacterium]
GGRAVEPIGATAELFAGAFNGVTGGSDPPGGQRLVQPFTDSFDDDVEFDAGSGPNGSGDGFGSQLTNITSGDGTTLSSITSEALTEANRTGLGSGNGQSDLTVTFEVARTKTFTLQGTIEVDSTGSECPEAAEATFELTDEGSLVMFERAACGDETTGGLERQLTLRAGHRYRILATADSFIDNADATRATASWNFALTGGQPPTPPPLACGDFVTGSRVLEGDLTCPATALFIAAPNITLDLGGHTISGDGDDTGTGVSNLAGHDDVTVKNGTITQMAAGATLDGSEGSRFSNLLLTQNRLLSLDVTNSVDVTVSNVTARESGFKAFQLGCDICTIRNNFADDNADAGFIVTGDGNTLTRNRAEFNDDGFKLTGANLEVTENKAIFNREAGFVISGPDGTLTENIAKNNTEDGFRLTAAPRAKLRQNVAKLNENTGFEIAQSDDVFMKGNTTNQNLSGGLLLLDTSGAKIKTTLADKNTGVGMLFVLADLATVTGNTVSNTLGEIGTTGDGFSLSGISESRFEGNLSLNNVKDGFAVVESDNNDLIANTAKRNVGDGFSVTDTSEDGELNDNIATKNSSAGFRIDDITTIGRGNRASRNGANCVLVTGTAMRCRG